MTQYANYVKDLIKNGNIFHYLFIPMIILLLMALFALIGNKVAQDDSLTDEGKEKIDMFLYLILGAFIIILLAMPLIGKIGNS